MLSHNHAYKIILDVCKYYSTETELGEIEVQ